jgi:hypothetical protein
VAMSSGRVPAFQQWIDAALADTILGMDRELWIGGFIREAYQRGWTAATLQVGRDLPLNIDRADIITKLTIAELQGVIEAFSQRAVRAFSDGLMSHLPPATVARSIRKEVDKVGIVRSRMTVQSMVVRANGEAALDCFQTAGRTHVDVLPETMPSPGRMHAIRDAKARSRRARRRGTRSATVEVLTAGDDDVCIICQDISESGPYAIADARGLIPAHPNCRCAFVPAEDKRFKHGDAIIIVDGFDPDEPRNERGEWTVEETIEMAKTQRELLAAIRAKKAGEQKGEAFINIPSPAQKIRNAEIMFGTGSPQHKAAIKKFGTKDEWNEEDHPRDPDGRFSEGSGISEGPAQKYMFGDKSDFEKINNSLRSGSGGSNDIKEKVAEIDKDFLRNGRLIDKDTTLYRGLSFDPKNEVDKAVLERIEAGSNFSDEGYAATTTERAIAENGLKGDLDKKDVMLIIHPSASKGPHALYNSSEKEYLLERGTSYKLGNIVDKGTHKEVHATALKLTKRYGHDEATIELTHGYRVVRGDGLKVGQIFRDPNEAKLARDVQSLDAGEGSQVWEVDVSDIGGAEADDIAVYLPAGTSFEVVGFDQSRGVWNIDARDEWNEEDHPRDPNGEFASVGSPDWDKIKNEVARARAQEALRKWQSDYERINGELREGEGESWREGLYAGTITDLTNAVRGAGEKLKEDIVTWRGIGGMGVSSFPSVGKEFIDQGFVSLSTSKRVAVGFTTGLEGIERDDKTLLKITVEKGSRVVQTPGGAHGQVEKELLLNRGTRFKVTGVKGRVVSLTALKQ